MHKVLFAKQDTPILPLQITRQFYRWRRKNKRADYDFFSGCSSRIDTPFFDSPLQYLHGQLLLQCSPLHLFELPPNRRLWYYSCQLCWGFPKQLKVLKTKKLAWNTLTGIVANNQVLAVAWMDNAPVYMLSTIHKIHMDDNFIERILTALATPVRAPFILEKYSVETYSSVQSTQID
jgi:hypothetical protein